MYLVPRAAVASAVHTVVQTVVVYHVGDQVGQVHVAQPRRRHLRHLRRQRHLIHVLVPVKNHVADHVTGHRQFHVDQVLQVFLIAVVLQGKSTLS